MMIHSLSRDSSPMVASANWDVGKPGSSSAPFADIFQGHDPGELNIPGTTIADMAAQNSFEYNYAVLAALSMVMIGGIFLMSPKRVRIDEIGEAEIRFRRQRFA